MDYGIAIFWNWHMNAALLWKLSLFPPWPDYTDISVDCGTTYIRLSILACPVFYTGYNESLLILNQIEGDSACTGTLDESVTPPVVRFTFPINSTTACGSIFRVRSCFVDIPSVTVSQLQHIDMGNHIQTETHTCSNVYSKRNMPQPRMFKVRYLADAYSYPLWCVQESNSDCPLRTWQW